MALRTARNVVLKNECIAFGLVIASILTVQAVVLSRGFTSVSADEYSRVLMAASWAESPYTWQMLLLDETSVWLPGYFCLLGLALKIHYDLFVTPHIVTMIFSQISLGMLYLLARKLFNRWVALLSVLIVGLLNVHVYLSLTPLADVIYYAFIISFLYFVLLWIDNYKVSCLLAAALMLGLATSFRYESWFTAAVFVLYLALYWLIGPWRNLSRRPVFLLSSVLAAALVWLVPCLWIWGHYIIYHNPLHFIHSFSTVARVGLLTYLSPKLAYVDLLIEEGALICLLAVLGITLSYRVLASRVWLYLALGLVPFVLLTLLTKGVWYAYSPRYVGQYLILLTPFCACAIHWAITAHEQCSRCRWQKTGRSMLVMISVYNLWLVYLRLSQSHSWILIGVLALIGIALSHQLLTRRHWLYWTLSLIPLPMIITWSKIDSRSEQSGLCLGLYFVLLALFYARIIGQAKALEPPSFRQWRIAGLGMLIAICVYSLWGTIVYIPTGMPASVIKSGRLVRQLFEEDALAESDRVLIETAPQHHEYNYKGMQVMSNHPSNFVLDRNPYVRGMESFLLDRNSSPYEVGRFFANYERGVNPLSLSPSPSLSEYLADRQIRLAVITDPRLEKVLREQAGFAKIGQVEDYLFYYSSRDERKGA